MVPYLRCSGDGRIVPLQAYWDGSEWHMWIPDGRGALIKLQIFDCASGLYVAKAPARDTDLHLPFLDFMWKHASWPDVTRWLVAIENDVVKLSAALAKIEHFEDCATFAQRFETDIFVATEVEYLFGRCRSLFDHLQHVIAVLWERIEPLEEVDARKKQQIPGDSFRKVAQKIRDLPDGVPPPYGLPETLVAAYKSVEDFFFSLRKHRDQLMHRGGDVDRIFVTDRGYAVEGRGPLARMFPKPEEADPPIPDLVALRPALAHLVCSTVYALNRFAEAFRRVITFPDSLIPDHAVFLRTPHAAALVSAQKVLRGGDRWKVASTPSEGP